MVLDILAVVVVFTLSFALLFRVKPIEFKITIEHKHPVEPSLAKEMLEELGKTEKQIIEDSESIIGFINNMAQGKGFDVREERKTD